jgi:hypothetical protein
MLRAWKMLCERNGVHLADVESFLFFDVASAPDPVKAKKALRNVSDLLAKLNGLSVQHQVDRYAALASYVRDERIRRFSTAIKQHHFNTTEKIPLRTFQGF